MWIRLGWSAWSASKRSARPRESTGWTPLGMREQPADRDGSADRCRPRLRVVLTHESVRSTHVLQKSRLEEPVNYLDLLFRCARRHQCRLGHGANLAF
jgi:hypothetical protein